MCRRCKRHAVPGKTMCQHHLEMQVRNSTASWKRRGKPQYRKGRGRVQGMSELDRLIRAQAYDMKHGHRNEAQRFGPGRVRTVLLSVFQYPSNDLI